MGSGATEARARIWVVAGGALIVASAIFFVLLVDAAVRATILVDTIPGGSGSSTRELDSYYQTMAWAFGASLGASVAAILVIRKGLRLSRTGLRPRK